MTIPPADTSYASATIFQREPPKPLDGFAPEEFRARRETLRAACPDGIILLRGSTEEETTGAARFQQNSTFSYLTGVSTPGAFLVLLPESVPANAGIRDLAPVIREILFLPPRNLTTETWTG